MSLERARRCLFFSSLCVLVFASFGTASSEVETSDTPSSQCEALWEDNAALVALCEQNQRLAKARFQSRAGLKVGDGATDYAAWLPELGSSPMMRACFEQELARVPAGAELDWRLIEDCVLQEVRPSRPAQAEAWSVVPRETLRATCGSLIVVSSFDHCFMRLTAHSLQSSAHATARLEAGAAEVMYDALKNCTFAQAISDAENKGPMPRGGFDGVSLRILKEQASPRADKNAADQCVREAALLVNEFLHEPIFDVCYLKRTDPRFSWISKRAYRETDAKISAACSFGQKGLDTDCLNRGLRAQELKCDWLESNGRGEMPDPNHVLALHICTRIAKEVSFDLRVKPLGLDGLETCLNEVRVRRSTAGS